jgi:hypothetical protein
MTDDGLASGYYDIPNRLDVPGEDLDKVIHLLLELFRTGARVTMVVRGPARHPQQRQVENPQTVESERKGVYLAGVIVAGMHTNEIFIEKGRFHGRLIAETIAGKPAEGSYENSHVAAE